MRALVLAVGLMTLVGCGKKSPTTEAPADDPVTVPTKKGGTNPQPPTPPQPPTKDDPVIDLGEKNDLVNQFKDNRIKAEAKYLGKRVRLKAQVDSVSRTKAGAAYIGHTHIYNPTGPKFAPTEVYIFPKEREADIAELKEGDAIVIEGRVIERNDDGVRRGIAGYEFHVRLEECRLVEASRGDKKIFPVEK